MSLVLVVDDQPGIRALLIGWISREGYQTAQAADAGAALDEMMGRPADVVCCDVHMPGRGGVWLADRLHERFPETAIILATGDGNVPPVISLQPGVVVYLAMPFGREGQGRPPGSPVASDVQGRSSQEERPERFHRDMAGDSPED
jgi:DNA-binding NtrC family response regulator